MGRYQEANDSLDKAIRIKPYAMIYFHKAEALQGWYGIGNILNNLSIDDADKVLARAKELKDNVKMRYNGWY